MNEVMSVRVKGIAIGEYPDESSFEMYRMDVGGEVLGRV